MSEQESKTEGTEATPAKPDVAELLKRHTIVSLSFDEIKANAEAHNAEAAKLAAASGSVEDVVKGYLNDITSTGDVKAVKLAEAVETLRERLAEAEGNLTAHLTPLAAKAVESSKGDTEALTKSVSEKASDVNASIGMFRKILKGRGYTDEETTAVISALPALSGKRRASSGGGGQSGKWRIRNFDFFDGEGNLLTVKVDLKRKVDGKDVVLKDQPVSNSQAVQVYAKCNADAVRDAFAEAQGTTDSGAFKPEVTFTILGSDNVSRTIKAVKNVEAAAQEAAESNGADVQ